MGEALPERAGPALDVGEAMTGGRIVLAARMMLAVGRNRVGRHRGWHPRYPVGCFNVGGRTQSGSDGLA